MKEKKRVFIFGYIGYGNLGDEAMMEALVSGLRAKQADLSIAVLSFNPFETARFYSVKAVAKTDAFGIVRALKGSSLLIGCGGSLLQDATSFRSLLYYCTLIRAAKALGCKVALLGQGIGPFKREVSRRLAAKTLDVCDLITLRDADSLELLKGLGVNQPQIELTADLSFGLPLPPSLSTPPLPYPSFTIGISLRPWRNVSELLPVIATSLPSPLPPLPRSGRGGLPARILLLPFHSRMDEPLCNQLITSLSQLEAVVCRVCRAETPSSMLETIGCLDLLIAMRLHALMFAAMVGVPFIALSYDPKVDAFARQVDERCVLPLTFSSEELTERMEWVVSERVRLQEEMRSLCANLRCQAARNLRALQVFF